MSVPEETIDSRLELSRLQVIVPDNLVQEFNSDERKLEYILSTAQTLIDTEVINTVRSIDDRASLALKGIDLVTAKTDGSVVIKYGFKIPNTYVKIKVRTSTDKLDNLHMCNLCDGSRVVDCDCPTELRIICELCEGTGILVILQKRLESDLTLLGTASPFVAGTIESADECNICNGYGEMCTKCKGTKKVDCPVLPEVELIESVVDALLDTSSEGSNEPRTP